MAKAPRSKRISDKAHQANIAEKKSKKRKGHAPGSRHSEPAKDKHSQGNTAKADPRLGSKKPISLNAPTAAVKEHKKYFSPAQELSAIEQDKRLETLLDKLEQDHSLSAEEQQYVDTKLARHIELCEVLGIDNPDNENDDDRESQQNSSHNTDEDILLDKFLNSNIKDPNQ